METPQTRATPTRGPGPRVRDRRGRGVRGPIRLPERPGVPSVPTSRQRFDRSLLRIVSDLDGRWGDRLGLVEYAVEETPHLPDDWASETVPLATLVRGTSTIPTRLVVFRRPIEHRSEDREELDALLLTVVVEQVAELLGLPADEVDPRYRPE